MEWLCEIQSITPSLENYIIETRGKMPVVLRLSCCQFESDVDGLFLANKEGATLGSAVARSNTDLHISGCSASSSPLLTTVDATVDIPAADLQVVESKGDGSLDKGQRVVKVPESACIVANTTRIAVGIDGTILTSVSSNGFAPMADLLRRSEDGTATSIMCSLASWQMMSSVVTATKARFVDSDTDERLHFEIVPDEEKKRAMARSEEILAGLYKDSVATRQKIKYVVDGLEIPLTKPVMKAVVGVNGCTYDLSAQMVDRPTSFSREGFESLFESCLRFEYIDDADFVDAFLLDCSQPCIKATEWADGVANALSALVSFACPYRVDGRSIVMPTGLVMQSAEFWQSGAARSMFSGDDCEGSGGMITSAVLAAQEVARDVELSSKYPFTSACANALAHHAVGVAVLAANAGQADDAGKHGHSQVAGHAIALAVPKAMMVQAMIIGIQGATGYGSQISEKQTELISKSKNAFAVGFYDPDDVKRMPENEQVLVSNADALIEAFSDKSSCSHMVPLAMEGTAPVSSCHLHEPDPREKMRQAQMLAKEQELGKKIGASIARTFSRMHVEPDNHHKFYKHFVEFLLPPMKTGTFFNETLRGLNLATSHWVFCQLENVINAGVAPEKLAIGNFAILPLWKVNAELGRDLDVGLAESLTTGAPMREEGTRLTVDETKQYSDNIEKLNKLKLKFADKCKTLTGQEASLRQLLCFAALARNVQYMDHYVSSLASNEHIKAACVQIDDVPGLIFDNEGNDVGKAVYLTLYAA